jgi:hypothetical protein
LEQEGPVTPRKNKKMFIFMSLGMAFFMSLGMSSVMTAVNVGAEAFPWIWLKSWLLGFAVALPLSIAVPRFLKWTASKTRIGG